MSASKRPNPTFEAKRSHSRIQVLGIGTTMKYQNPATDIESDQDKTSAQAGNGQLSVFKMFLPIKPSHTRHNLMKQSILSIWSVTLSILCTAVFSLEVSAQSNNNSKNDFKKHDHIKTGHSAYQANRDFVFSSVLTRLQADHILSNKIKYVRRRGRDIKVDSVTFIKNSSNYIYLLNRGPGKVSFNLSRQGKKSLKVSCKWTTFYSKEDIKQVKIFDCYSSTLGLLINGKASLVISRPSVTDADTIRIIYDAGVPKSLRMVTTPRTSGI